MVGDLDIGRPGLQPRQRREGSGEILGQEMVVEQTIGLDSLEASLGEVGVAKFHRVLKARRVHPHQGKAHGQDRQREEHPLDEELPPVVAPQPAVGEKQEPRKEDHAESQRRARGHGKGEEDPRQQGMASVDRGDHVEQREGEADDEGGEPNLPQHRTPEHVGAQREEQGQDGVLFDAAAADLEAAEVVEQEEEQDHIEGSKGDGELDIVEAPASWGP